MVFGSEVLCFSLSRGGALWPPVEQGRLTSCRGDPKFLAFAGALKSFSVLPCAWSRVNPSPSPKPRKPFTCIVLIHRILVTIIHCCSCTCLPHPGGEGSFEQAFGRGRLGRIVSRRWRGSDLFWGCTWASLHTTVDVHGPRPPSVCMELAVSGREGVFSSRSLSYALNMRRMLESRLLNVLKNPTVFQGAPPNSNRWCTKGPECTGPPRPG